MEEVIPFILYGKKKETGRIYELIKEDAQSLGVSPHEIVHIGDNFQSDVGRAQEAGLVAARFDPLYDQTDRIARISADDEAELSQVGRIWSSFCNQSLKLWKMNRPELAADFFTKLGFEVSGPLAAMMAIFAKQKAEQIGASDIVFAARDGRIIKDLFDYLFGCSSELRSHYLALSRATTVAGTFGHPLSANDLYFLTDGIHLGAKPIEYFLTKANLSCDDSRVRSVVSKFFPSSRRNLNWSDLPALTQALRALSGLIYEANAESRELLKGYLDQSGVLKNSGKVLFVDVGWLLNIQARLSNFLES